jgi:hypothetical protein
VERQTRPLPVFIGYFPKRTAHHVAWIENAAVQEIASASNCISGAPDGWLTDGSHNMPWWLYDTEDAGLHVIKDFDEAPEAYDMYAYKLFPIMFDGVTMSALDVETTAQGSLEGYQFLGYDMVSRSQGTNFECSPLSCNNGCVRYPVNPYCLVDDLEDAWRITQEIAQTSKAYGAWEPGPYYLVEVYRKR